jgi:hypothetical protein
MTIKRERRRPLGPAQVVVPDAALPCAEPNASKEEEMTFRRSGRVPIGLLIGLLAMSADAAAFD